MLDDWQKLDEVSYLSLMEDRIGRRFDRQKFVKQITSSDLYEKFDGLRGFYRLANQGIFDAGRCEWGFDIYEVDWISVFTPIEFGLWHDIRDCGAVLYPQYPVGRFFVDFANPVAKVAIECDGFRYHQDKAKDDARQREIEALGWTVYRITGRDCLTAFCEETMTEAVARSFIKQIVEAHGISRDCRLESM